MNAEEELERQIARQESLGHKDNPFVQMMRDQLARMKEGERSTQDLYITGSVKKTDADGQQD